MIIILFFDKAIAIDKAKNLIKQLQIIFVLWIIILWPIKPILTLAIWRSSVAMM